MLDLNWLQGLLMVPRPPRGHQDDRILEKHLMEFCRVNIFIWKELRTGGTAGIELHAITKQLALGSSPYVKAS